MGSTIGAQCKHQTHAASLGRELGSADSLADASEPAGSALATELRTLPDTTLRTLGLDLVVVEVLDLVVALLQIVARHEDPAEWIDGIESVFAGRLVDSAWSNGDLNAVQAELQIVAERLHKSAPQVVKTWQRATGAAAFRRLKVAAGRDLDVARQGLRNAMDVMLPFARALDACGVFLTAAQVEQALPGLGTYGSLTRLAVDLDGALGDTLRELSTRLLEPSEEDSSGDDPGVSAQRKSVQQVAEDVEAVLERVEAVFASKSTDVLADLSAKLSRKVQGARDAVALSADGVSQAANSLIEFTDRLLRTAFPDAEVASWLTAERIGQAGMLDQNGQPTKRARALCFVHGGGNRPESDGLAEIAAAGLVAARTRLQRLKHADDGTPEEVAEVEKALGAVEGFMVYAVRVGWAGLDDAHLSALRSRLGDPAPIEIASEARSA